VKYYYLTLVTSKYPNEETIRRTSVKEIDERLKNVKDSSLRMQIIKEWQENNKKLGAVKKWQDRGDGVDREAVPTMRQGALQRGLSRLHGQTKTRRGSSGEREFLLYRTLDNAREEHKLVEGQKFKVPNTKTSWSPKLNYAQSEAKIMKELVVGVWVPESLIINIPKMYGNFERPPGRNKWAKEWEIILKGGTGQHLEIGYKFDQFFDPEYIKEEEEEEEEYSWKSLFPA
jgi:hypothetical protein